MECANPGPKPIGHVYLHYPLYKPGFSANPRVCLRYSPEGRRGTLVANIYVLFGYTTTCRTFSSQMEYYFPFPVCCLQRHSVNSVIILLHRRPTDFTMLLEGLVFGV